MTRRLDYEQDNRGYLGDARRHVFLADTATGERRQVTRRADDHLLPQWPLSARRWRSRATRRALLRLGLLDVATGSLIQISAQDGGIGSWAWSTTGESILFAGDLHQAWQLNFFLRGVVGGETRRLTDDLDCLPHAGYPTLVPPSQPVWLDDRHEWYAAHSPSTNVHRIRTPTLLVHGEADQRCPIGQGEQMFTALHNAGCEVEFARYPGASHLFVASEAPGHRAELLARALSWFQRHLTTAPRSTVSDPWATTLATVDNAGNAVLNARTRMRREASLAPSSVAQV